MEEDLFSFEDSPIEESSIQEAPDPNEITEDTQFESSDFESEKSDDYITKLLENKGIRNKTVQIADEDGVLQDVDFDSLSDAEKYDLLTDGDDEYSGPTDEEVDILNYLRQNNMSLQDFANWQKQLGVQEYLGSQAPVTEFDNYSDEEMVAYDYIRRFGEDMSDEEIDAEIDRLKSDPEAFEKRVALLRNEYRNEEEAQARLYQEQEEKQNHQNIIDFQNAYIDAASGMNYIHGVDLDNNDKEELLNFVLTKDAAGRTGLAKALDDPQAVLNMAWYLLHGEDTYDATVDYFKKEISKTRGGTRAVTRQRNASKDAFKF